MINVDISNIWGEVSLPELLGLEAEVAGAHEEFLAKAGEGWLSLPGQAVADILAAADTIRGQSDVLVVLGTGTAVAGIRGALELLRDDSLASGRASLPVIFAGDSFSARKWNEITELLDGKEISVCVIDGAADSLETDIALRSLKWNLERRYGTDEARGRIFAVVFRQESALHRLAQEETWTCFRVPELLDADLAVLSAAGLLPMAAAGIDITRMLEGAGEADRAYGLRSFENPVWLYAAVRELMRRQGKAVERLCSFEPDFMGLGRWWQQLFGSDTEDLYPVAELLPVVLHRGPSAGNRMFETVLQFDPPANQPTVGEDVRDLQKLNCIAGMELGRIAGVAELAMVQAHTDMGLSIVNIECGGMDDHAAGALFRFFELARGICACIRDAYPPEKTGAAAFYMELDRQLGRVSAEEIQNSTGN